MVVHIILLWSWLLENWSKISNLWISEMTCTIEFSCVSMFTYLFPEYNHRVQMSSNEMRCKPLFNLAALIRKSQGIEVKKTIM